MAGRRTSNGRNKPAEAPAPTQDTLPPFYRTPVVVSSARHGRLRFSRPTDFSVARDMPGMPVNLSEFLQAQVSCPIVFTRDDVPFPMVMLGRTGGTSLFVGEDGRWAADTYVPAYVRRYPFILTAVPGTDEHALCIDTADGRLGETEGEPLYDEDGKATGAPRNAGEFCARCHRDHLATWRLCEALKEKDLFEPGAIRLSTAAGRTIDVGGYMGISRKAFDKLDDETFLDWRRNGRVAAIYAHLLSVANWQKIGNRMLKAAA